MTDLVQRLDERGYAVVEGLLDPTAVDDLAARISMVESARGLNRNGEVFAIRNLAAVVPQVCELAESEPVRARVDACLGRRGFLVRSLFFDKSRVANWKVPWHQDMTISVRKRLDMNGFGPWSMKAGIPHCQAPTWLLERMLTMRIHLDPCDDSSGPLMALPGSHLSGKLNDSRIDVMKREIQPDSCIVGAGGAVIMKPLVVHSSGAAVNPSHRRVIHLEFACDELPGGLVWFERGV